MASKAQKERRAQFARYKEDVKKEGKPFYPYAIWHDTVMALVVVCVIIALACVWYFTAKHADDGVGLLGPLVTDKADPGTTDFVPRPDWFFYFLFYLLRIFKWPDSVFLGTVGVPTILLILLIGLPFYDRSRERRLLRRPVALVAAVLVVVSMATLTWKGALAKESIASENRAKIPQWAEKQGFTDNQKALSGARVFASQTCLTCHTYLGSGSSNVGAPDLSSIGDGQTAAFFRDYIPNAAIKYGNQAMAVFAGLPKDQVDLIASFLAASKGPK
jgi:ubiquinol-cytochrome c reductase cytochrome b subunit/menaquinol-cytochrome c reductase cytochrome b/c subunit